MKQLFLDLAAWIAPRETPNPQRSSQPLPQPSSLGSPAVSFPNKFADSKLLPTEPELEAICRTLLIRVGCPDLAQRICVQWNPRLQSTAGRAHYVDSKVVLNPRLLAFGSDEIDRTLRHELAHLLAKFRVGRHKIAPHGAEWKQACRDLGLMNEKRTHTLPLPRRTVRRRHSYSCPSCGTVVARVKPFRSRVACLSCCRKFGKGRYDERFRLIKL